MDEASCSSDSRLALEEGLKEEDRARSPLGENKENEPDNHESEKDNLSGNQERLERECDSEEKTSEKRKVEDESGNPSKKQKTDFYKHLEEFENDAN